MRFRLALPGVVMMAGFMLPSGARADVTLHGFVQGNYAVNTTSANPDGDSFKWAEERLQLKLDGQLLTAGDEEKMARELVAAGAPPR